MSGGVNDDENNDGADNNNDLQKYFSNGEGEKQDQRDWEEDFDREESHESQNHPMSMDEFGSPAK